MRSACHVPSVPIVRREAALLFVLLAGLGCPGSALAASTADASGSAQPVPVTAVVARTGELDHVIYGIGTVAPLQSVTVRPRISGQVVGIPFAEGQTVARGDVILRLDDTQLRADLASAEAKKAQDMAQVANAKADVERYASLAEKGVASTSTLEQKQAYNQELAAAIQYDDAVIKNAEAQLGFATVRAPFEGRAGFRQVDVGAIVDATSTDGIVTITQMDPIGVSFVAPGDRFGEIREAMKEGLASVEVTSTDGSRRLATGRLTIMDNAVDAQNGSIHLRAEFDNRDGRLWPGLPVATRLTVERRTGVVVPDKALARGPDGLYAYVVGADARASRHAVTAAYVTDARALVTKGIADGDQVVMDGQSRIGDGAAVTVAPWTGSPTGELSEAGTP